MLMILARLVRAESFWAVVKVRSPHTGPGIRYIIAAAATGLALPLAGSYVPTPLAEPRGRDSPTLTPSDS